MESEFAMDFFWKLAEKNRRIFLRSLFQQLLEAVRKVGAGHAERIFFLGPGDAPRRRFDSARIRLVTRLARISYTASTA
jgi:hypothetical protein